MASLPHHQPLVYNLCIRLPYRTEHQYGYSAHPYHTAVEGYHISVGKEELHEFGKDASIETET